MDPTSAALRLFQPDDHAAAYRLWQATPGVGLSAADDEAPIHRFLARNPGLSWVAEADGQLIGTVLCGHDGRRGLIHHLAVATDHRRRGIARQLVDRALVALAEQQIDKCHLLVFADNADGRVFWASVGAGLRGELAVYSLVTKTPVTPFRN